MYIDVTILNELAKLVGSMTVIVGVIIGVYRYIVRDRRQSKVISDIQEEQTLLCYSIKACLEGLAEQGCDGPVHDAIKRLDKHLNKKAHDVEV